MRPDDSSSREAVPQQSHSNRARLAPAAWVAILLLAAGAARAQDHAANDARAAELSQNYAPFEVDASALNIPGQTDYDVFGAWGPVLAWPHIPVSSANLPDGRVLTFSSNQRDDFPGGAPEYTFAAIWDPENNSIVERDHDAHDMFCGHLVMLEDGRVMVAGGRNHVPLTSIFDAGTESWTALEDMNNGRWYPTAVAMADGGVFIGVGSSGGRYPEVWKYSQGWNSLTGADLQGPILDYTGFYENDWWPYFILAPDGAIAHYGPTPTMLRIDTNANSGTGAITHTAPLGMSWYPKHGASVMYAEGKVLLAGGANTGSNQSSVNGAVIVDLLSGTAPSIQSTNPMAFARKFHNAVALANGEVMMVGGNTSGAKFNDSGSVLTGEIWNPTTEQWRPTADMLVPRNYHSIALLLTDGRVLSAGGGLCGSCSANHQDAQVYSPPYLFDADGNLAPRPAITSAPDAVTNGFSYPVVADAGITAFNAVKMSANTHAVNTDQRFLALPFSEDSPGTYTLTPHSNVNVLTPGYYMVFAIDAAGTPSLAHVMQVVAGVRPANYPPSLSLPDRQSETSEIVDVQLPVVDIDPDPHTWTITGLPPGLTDDGAGRITGTAAVPGSYLVDATVDDGTQTANDTFSWSILQGATNLALAGSASQSSTPGSGLAAKAIDGQINGDFAQGSVSETDNDANAWWQADLGAVHDIGSIVVHNRTDCCSDRLEPYSVFVSDVPFDSTDLVATRNQADVSEYEFTSFPVQSQTVPLSRSGRYVRVQLHDQNVLNLAEVQVFSLASGIAYEYFEGTNFDELSDLDGLTPVDYGVVDQFDISGRLRDDDFGYRFVGEIVVPTSGNYIFYTTSDDGSKLWIDGALVVDNDGLHGTRERSGNRSLTAGLHEIEVTFFERGGGQVLEVRYAGPGISKQLIAPGVLLHDAGDLFNQAPRLSSPGNQQTPIDTAVSLQLLAADPDSDPLVFGVSGLPAGLSMDASGLVSGTVTSVGSNTVSIDVSDPLGLTDELVFDWTVSAALAIDPIEAPAAVVGANVPFAATLANGIAPELVWNFGDGTPPTAPSSDLTTSHSYSAPGRYLVTVEVSDGLQQVSTDFIQTVHAPLTAGAPAASMSLIIDPNAGAPRLWVVNADNDSVSVFDTTSHAKLAEVPVGATPRSLALAPDGRAWVASERAARIDIIDPTSWSVAETIDLPRGSKPYGLVLAPGGATAWVALAATGEVAQLDVASRTLGVRSAVGADVKHLSITADGATLFAARFITPPITGEDSLSPQPAGEGGIVVALDTALLTTQPIVLGPSPGPDASNAGRGIPNYLGPAVVSPDGSSAWLASKQDNIERGSSRDGMPLTHDSTVRSISSKIDLSGPGAPAEEARFDHDDAGAARTGAFHPTGNYLFVALEGSREVSMLDVYAHTELVRMQVGRAPAGLALSDDGLVLYVHNFMDRTVTVHDIHAPIHTSSQSTPLVATYDLVASEQLSPQILNGKQLFYDSADTRLALQGYISCASCHRDGGQDGRVWDLAGFGEGLRNTIELNGRAGMAHGPLHWSANFDEVHDFEGQIRGLSIGTGLMSPGDFAATSDPLGAPKAGLSADLDALAAYVGSLNQYDESPHRQSDGSLTPSAVAGRLVFADAGCADCHNGTAYTDSASLVLHDIGTIQPSSGNRLGGPLPGIDTPTLRGLWSTAPYLHDGSAATLEATISAHGIALPSPQLSELVDYLLQIDADETTSPEPPVWTDPGAQNSAEGDVIALATLATDPNGDPVSYSATGLPTSLSIHPSTGEITGTLGFDDAGGYAATLFASDGDTLRSLAVQWTVTNTNRAPVWNPPPAQTDAEGTAISLGVVAADADGDPVSYAAAGLPTGLAIDPASGIIAGTLGYNVAGVYNVTLTASDGVDPAEQALSWTVTEANAPPYFPEPASQTSFVAVEVDLWLSAIDPEGDPLFFSGTDVPPGLVVEPNGWIHGTPESSGVGPHTVTLEVSDPGHTVGHSISWTIEEAPPSVPALPLPAWLAAGALLAAAARCKLQRRTRR